MCNMSLDVTCAGLWLNLCTGKLPARCTKEWFFETFCGVSPVEFAARALHELGANVSIQEYLRGGYVKPCPRGTFARAPRVQTRRDGLIVSPKLRLLLCCYN